jgi:hypothetical protein
MLKVNVLRLGVKKLESKDSLLVWVWHSIELPPLSLACQELAIYGHVGG